MSGECGTLKNVHISVAENSTEEGFGLRGTRSACSYSPGTQPAIRLHICSYSMVDSYVRVIMLEGNAQMTKQELEPHRFIQK